MWAVLPRKGQILIVVAAAVVVVWALDAVLDWWTEKDGSVLGRISLTATILGVVLVGVAEKTWRHIWRWVPPLGRWIFPDLTGQWEGTLTSNWEKPETKSRLEPIAATIAIRQGLFSTAVSLETAETPTSHSKHCILEAYPETARWRIWYSYDNEPMPELRHRSSAHKGVAWLEFTPGRNREELIGQYYTDRMTAGSIRVHRVSTEVDWSASTIERDLAVR
jgi:hypothetical protein